MVILVMYTPDGMVQWKRRKETTPFYSLQFAKFSRSFKCILASVFSARLRYSSYREAAGLLLLCWRDGRWSLIVNKQETTPPLYSVFPSSPSFLLLSLFTVSSVLLSPLCLSNSFPFFVSFPPSLLPCPPSFASFWEREQTSLLLCNNTLLKYKFFSHCTLVNF